MKQLLLKLILRKTRANIGQILGMSFLIIIGSCFFISLSTISRSYEETGKAYFETQNYASATLFGTFSEEDLSQIKNQKDIRDAAGRYVQDYHVGDGVIRAVSITDGINLPYLYEGNMPARDDECLVLHKYAVAHNISMGDTFMLDQREVKVSGIAGSPEYVYLVRSINTPMADVESFGVVFVPSTYFRGDYSEVVVLSDVLLDADELKTAPGAKDAYLQEKQTNYILYTEDIEQISMFAVIFPATFVVLIIAVIYVMIKRNITKDRKQVGVMKAVGVSDDAIINLYVCQNCIIAVISAVIGCLSSVLLSRVIIRMLSFMFELPGLSFRFYSIYWIGTAVVALALTYFASFISVRAIKKTLPSEDLQVRMPAANGQEAKNNTSGFWNHFSFNTRYSLKSAIRNKGRFFAVILGMCGASALLILSLGFRNSINHTQELYLNDFASYAITVDFPPVSLDVDDECIDKLDDAQKVYQKLVDVNGKKYTTTVVENDFDMLQLNQQKLAEGVVIPEKFAKDWNVGVGDTVQLDGVNMVVSDVIPLTMRLSTFTSYEYTKTVNPDFVMNYNRVYGRSSQLEPLVQWLNSKEYEHNTIDDIRASFDSFLKGINTLIVLMIVCATLLGFTLLYTVSQINLASREYEFMFISIMGYSKKSIILVCLKESLIQILISLPIGYVIGYGLVYFIKDMFSGDNLILGAYVSSGSYLGVALIIVGVSLVNVLLSYRHVASLDIVEGLKESE